MNVFFVTQKQLGLVELNNIQVNSFLSIFACDNK